MTVEAHYQPNGDQRELAGAFADTLSQLLPIARLRKTLGESAETWSALERLGLFGIAVPEVSGGVGLGAVEEALIVIGLGRCLASPAVLATLGAVHAPRTVSTQTVRAAAAFGDEIVTVVEDACIEALLVRTPGGAELRAVGALGERVDGQWMANLLQGAEPGENLGTFDDTGVLRLRLIDAAALAGLAHAALDMAVAYAKFREQFGRPIGSFQAVKHHCANMAIAARSATDLTTFAAVAVDRGRDDAAVQVESAFVVAAGAALENAGKNIQIHGGIGFSDEADPHLFLKRAQLQIAIGGGVEAALDRLAGLRSDADQSLAPVRAGAEERA